ncbi:MAG: ankyrin repeat domain-containing protein [Acidobacteriota bacterium]
MKQFIDALDSGNTAAVKRQLETDLELAAGRADNVSVIVYSAYRGLDDMVSMLVAARRAIEAPLDLWETIVVGDLERADELLTENPASVDSTAEDGFSPIGLAAFFGHAPIVERLLAVGADAARPSDNAMRVAPLHSAIAHRDRERSRACIRLLLDAGVPVNIAQAGGWTPLHQAAAQGDETVVGWLLERGAEPATQAHNGQTSAQLAAERGHEEIAARLSR